MSKTFIEATTLRPLRNSVFVSDLQSGVRKTQAGILIPDDNMKDSGIHARWAKVHAVGPDVDDLVPGDWVLVAHGRWTNAIDFMLPDGDIKLWRIDYPDAILLAADENPTPTEEMKF